ncbi:Serine/threonine-protein kinase 11-interacting protein, partial [Dufourea novaeangliae]
MNSFQDAASMQEIVELGKLLRQNGDKVLSASSKLSLSTTLLYNLNKAFSSIVDKPEDLESSFQVCNSSEIDIFCHLKFLHDFVQKTVGLKVTCCTNNTKIPVDITKFKHLKYLELKKINIESVKGLQSVRGQLESVISAGRKGICTVSQLLESCGGDAGIGFLWSSLKHLALPHNALERLDASLELAPWLQIIDLSHNLITSADELSCLPNLKYVNLGYNKLDTIPVFNKAASHSLQVLVLKSNYIENLSGLQNLEYLQELDLSFNCLMEHSTLWVLEKMSTLLWILLEGNPLSYHPKHRLVSIKYLRPRFSLSKFVLDHLPLSKSEKQVITENRLFTTRSEQSISNEFLTSVSNSLNSSSLSVSVTAPTMNEFDGAEKSTENSFEKCYSKNKKKSNVKKAVITEDDHGKKCLNINTETSKDHLETKKQILALRKQFGEDKWLSSLGGTIVQDIMGFQPSSYSSLTPDGTSAVSSTQDSIVDAIENIQADAAENSACSTNENNETSSRKELNVENVSETPLSDTTNTFVQSELHYDLYHLEEETGDLYLVQKKKNDDELEELFLIITS